MVFNSKGKFFLNLDEKGAATPVTVAPVAKPAPKAEAKPKAITVMMNRCVIS